MNTRFETIGILLLCFLIISCAPASALTIDNNNPSNNNNAWNMTTISKHINDEIFQPQTTLEKMSRICEDIYKNCNIRIGVLNPGKESVTRYLNLVLMKEVQKDYKQNIIVVTRNKNNKTEFWQLIDGDGTVKEIALQNKEGTTYVIDTSQDKLTIRKNTYNKTAKHEEYLEPELLLKVHEPSKYNMTNILSFLDQKYNKNNTYTGKDDLTVIVDWIIQQLSPYIRLIQEKADWNHIEPNMLVLMHNTNYYLYAVQKRETNNIIVVTANNAKYNLQKEDFKRHYTGIALKGVDNNTNINDIFNNTAEKKNLLNENGPKILTTANQLFHDLLEIKNKEDLENLLFVGNMVIKAFLWDGYIINYKKSTLREAKTQSMNGRTVLLTKRLDKSKNTDGLRLCLLVEATEDTNNVCYLESDTEKKEKGQLLHRNLKEPETVNDEDLNYQGIMLTLPTGYNSESVLVTLDNMRKSMQNETIDVPEWGFSDSALITWCTDKADNFQKKHPIITSMIPYAISTTGAVIGAIIGFFVAGPAGAAVGAGIGAMVAPAVVVAIGGIAYGIGWLVHKGYLSYHKFDVSNDLQNKYYKNRTI